MTKPPDDLMLARLNTQYKTATANVVLGAALDLYRGQITMVSSFGADSAVLLHLLARIDPDVPVLMVDTLMLFPETLQYQTELSQHLGLRDVRIIRAQDQDLDWADSTGDLHLSDPDACCGLRKVAPLARALTGFGAAITGRKRFQTGQRARMDLFERDQSRLRVNPLAAWRPEQIGSYLRRHDLPPHPLVAHGFASIGCAPCTSRIGAGEDPRSGRWRGRAKVECGIHFGTSSSASRGIA